MNLYKFSFRQGETGLLIKSDRDGVLDPIKRAIRTSRAQLLAHIDENPEFRWSVEPLAEPTELLPNFISEMYRAGSLAGVGPFASVAGAMASVAARAAVRVGASNILVENGGDLCLYGRGPFMVAVYAGSSPFSQRIGFKVRPGKNFAGLCTSSSKVGESISFGEADAVVAYSSESAVVADAVATSVCNEVRGLEGVNKGIEKAKSIGKVGIMVIHGERLGAWGNLPELLDLNVEKVDLVIDPTVHSRA